MTNPADLIEVFDEENLPEQGHIPQFKVRIGPMIRYPTINTFRTEPSYRDGHVYFSLADSNENEIHADHHVTTDQAMAMGLALIRAAQATLAGRRGST